jgi:hypothetical protein
MRAFCGFAVLTLLLTLPAIGADDGKVQKGPKRDPKALEFIKQAVVLCTNAKTLHVEVDVETNVQNGEEKQDISNRCTYDLERPDRFALRTRHTKDKESGLDYVSDGKTVLVHSMRLKQYTESQAPKSVTEIGERLARFGRSASGFFVPNLLTEDPYESLVDDILSCSYAGKEKLGAVEAHHVKVVHPEIKWELWIAAERKPLVLKAATLVAVDEIRVTASEIYKNWKLDEPPDRTTFTITAPANATKVDALGAPKKSK